MARTQGVRLCRPDSGREGAPYSHGPSNDLGYGVASMLLRFALSISSSALTINGPYRRTSSGDPSRKILDRTACPLQEWSLHSAGFDHHHIDTLGEQFAT